MYFLFPLLLLLPPASTSFAQNSPCNCEKILKEGECNDPDCIKICNLEGVFDSAGKLIKNKCLKGTRKSPAYKATDIRASEIEDHLEESNQKYNKIKKRNESILKKNCPGCNISSQMKALMKPVIEKDICNKYIKTNHFKRWRKTTDKRSSYCQNQTNSEGSSSRSSKARQLCKNDKVYQQCCPARYLNKSYKLNYTLPHEDKPKQCTEEHEEEIHEEIKEYMIDIMQGNSTAFSKKIFKNCPDGCSFDATINSLKINTKNCSGNLELTVLCSHKAKRSGFMITLPVYNMKVTYEEDIKCQN